MKVSGKLSHQLFLLILVVFAITFLMLGIILPQVVVPITEKNIYNYLKEENQKQGMLLTTLLFALSHTGLFNMLYAFILGIILIYLKERYTSLKAPISFHIGVNTMAILFTFFI